MKSHIYDELAEIYDIWSTSDPEFNSTQNFYVNFCKNYSEPIIELGVGTGRIALELASQGKHVIGIDESQKMLDKCKIKADKVGVSSKIQLINADMRNFRLSKKAKLVIIPFRTIGHLLTFRDKVEALKCIYDNLDKEGILVFDHYNFNEDWAQAHDGVPRLMISHQISTEERIFIWDTYKYDFQTQFMECYITTERTNNVGKVLSRIHAPLTFSWVSPEDIKKMLIESGFKIKKFYGDFNFEPFHEEVSRNQIIIATKND